MHRYELFLHRLPLPAGTAADCDVFARLVRKVRARHIKQDSAARIVCCGSGRLVGNRRPVAAPGTRCSLKALIRVAATPDTLGHTRCEPSAPRHPTSTHPPISTHKHFFFFCRAVTTACSRRQYEESSGSPEKGDRSMQRQRTPRTKFPGNSPLRLNFISPDGRQSHRLREPPVCLGFRDSPPRLAGLGFHDKQPQIQSAPGCMCLPVVRSTLLEPGPEKKRDLSSVTCVSRCTLV